MDENDVPADNRNSQPMSELRARLAEAEETLRAIRHGEVDALVIADGSGDRVYTLHSADTPYRALVEQMQDGAVTLNITGDIVYCNRRFAELVDVPLQQAIGAPIYRFIGADDRAALKTLILDGRGSLHTRLIGRGTSPIDAHLSVSTVTLDDVQRRTLIVTDVSTLKRTQRESRSKDEFLAMLAHELRNPLAAIGSAVQVLRLADPQDSRAKRARDVVEHQVLHMGRLIDDSLDVARVMVGKIELERKPVNLADVARSSVAATTPNDATRRRVEITAESVWVSADAIRLEQIVSNLVSNALKFTPHDKAIRLSVSAEGQDAVLRVTDEGAGIEPDLLARVFELFVQADGAGGRSKGGLGMGLTLVRQLVELHGGTVAASSGGHGQGSMFSVHLPRIPSVDVSTGPASSRTRGSGKKVLLVDDHPDVREMCSLVLRAAGHEVYEASDGESAIALVRRAIPDVAIVDIGLPDMDGYEVARRIRHEPEGRDMLLIALTGYGFPKDRENSRAAGFDRHFVKPASPESLLRELNQRSE
jgi:PAS domain S-box-containing protein